MARPIVYPVDFKFEPQTYYHVKVSWFNGNPLHDSILYTGFLDKNGWPLGYHAIWNPSGDGPREFAHNPRVVLHVVKELDMPKG